MEFLTKPVPFVEAVKKLGSKRRVARNLSSAEWQDIPTDLRERAFFSAHMESARWLQQAQNTIGDFLAANRQEVTLPDGSKSTSLKAGSREEFVDKMRSLFGGGPDEGGGAITDPASSTRLRLIFTTQVRQAWGYGNFKEGNQPEILDAWPAQRFIRGGFVQEARPLHEKFEGAIRLKSDHDFWRSMNSPAIGGFDVPHGPWGFNSQMDVEDVSREEAEALGMLKPGEQIENPEVPFNEQLSASTQGLSPEMIEKLKAQLGPEVEFTEGRARWAAEPTDPKPKRTPKPKPAPEPEVVKPPEPTPPAPTKQPTLEEYRNSVIERGVIALEMPVAERGKISLTIKTSVPLTAARAQAAANWLEGIVSPKALPKINVTSTRGRRSSCGLDGTLKMSKDALLPVYGHEIAHAIEFQNPEILRKCIEFYDKRTAGEVDVRLSALTGERGYKAHEVAKKDHWKERGGSHYCGKVYRNSITGKIYCTEILTMGVQRLMENAQRFAKEDPDYFDFTVSVLKGL